MTEKSYFLYKVLPSVGLPEKPSYTIEDACSILRVSRSTLYKMTKDQSIQITETGPRGKRIYKQEFIDYFSEYDYTEDDE